MKIHIGQRIKALANKKNLDARTMAELLGKTSQAVYDIYRKEDVSTEILWKFSEILDIPITSFFDDAPTTVHKERIKQGGTGNVNNVVKNNNFFSDKEMEMEGLRNKNIALEAQNKLLIELIDKFSLIPGKSNGEVFAEREMK